ncbi:hypothetical protein [Methanoregula sp.]|uniref:hypothetical protein n=1 Tax=Methanoregula sp. TaxID=2052170 RepID=UPI000CB57602|nr:hypothetical protein [Methanoregula sp.]PKG33672.1 MAG: hypothetical protein CW742_01715 [Methanoregula sp.]
MSEPEKTFEPATCCHCDGEGCLYCNKTGTVLVRAPKTPCGPCEGVGCIYCGFTGWAGPKSRCD